MTNFLPSETLAHPWMVPCVLALAFVVLVCTVRWLRRQVVHLLKLPFVFIWMTIRFCGQLLRLVATGWKVLVPLLLLWLGWQTHLAMQVDISMDRNKPGYFRLADLQPYVPTALIHAEDQRFMDRSGPIDARAFGRALVSTLKGNPQGASTLPMQVARTCFDLGFGRDKNAKSPNRKLREIIVGWRICSTYKKEDIIEFYLNHVLLADGYTGLERASQGIFGCPAKQLSENEIYGLLRSARAPYWFNTAERLQEGCLSYIGILRKRGVLVAPPGDLEITLQFRPMRFKRDQAVSDRPVKPVPQPKLSQNSRLLACLAMLTLTTVTADTAPMPIYLQAELRRHHADVETPSTLDFRLTETLQTQLLAFVDKLNAAHPGCGLQGSVALLDGESADIRALCQTTPNSEYSLNTQSRRQLASLEKTFILLAGLDAGLLTLEEIFLDHPVRAAWPQNAGGKTYGQLSLLEAYQHSVNTVFVQIYDRPEIPPHVAALHARMALPAPTGHDLSEALGTLAVTNLQVAEAYAAIAHGSYRPFRLAKAAAEPPQPAAAPLIASAAALSQTRLALACVATAGSAKALAKFPGIMAKTGSTTRDLRLVVCWKGTVLALWVGGSHLWPDAYSGEILAPFAADLLRKMG